ncbi:MAG: right-handed parallel beta-helix repeat-containing protein [Armatimonadota bacterium]
MQQTGWCAVVLMALLLSAAARADEETFGCEANPTGDPIGGGEGYGRILEGGDFTATTAEELVGALQQAQPGQVIYLPDGVEIDLTEHGTLAIPEGVTLAGSRGRDGSPGALIHMDDAGRMFSAGDNVRLTGLRFRGHYGGSERIGESSRFISLGGWSPEIDNCEIYNFNVSGIGVGSGAMDVQIHHNFIHHCQRGGLGYGISLSSSDVHIIANIFDYCRHHIASSGSPGSGYEAAWNLVLEHATSHHFDMHGGRDRGDGTDIAGDWMHVHHNTFRSTQRHVVIRGVPSDGAEVHHNWFAAEPGKAVVTGGNTRVYRNVYGPERTLEE